MCLPILWALQFNFGPVSSSKFQFSNYSPALSLNCQSFYFWDNTIPLGIKQEAGEAALLSAYKSCNLTRQSPSPTALQLFKKQQHSQQQSTEEMFSYRVSTEKASPAHHFITRKVKLKQLFPLLKELGALIPLAISPDQVFTN